MEIQRLRNLTTGRLHTDVSCVYEDLEFITGMSGIATHQIPNIMEAAQPWLKLRVTDQAFWDDKHRPDHNGHYPLEPMNEAEQAEFMSRYEALPHPFETMSEERNVCVGCGCDDLHACIEPETGNGCHWLRLDGEGSGVCSECHECIDDWDKESRS